MLRKSSTHALRDGKRKVTSTPFSYVLIGSRIEECLRAADPLFPKRENVYHDIDSIHTTFTESIHFYLQRKSESWGFEDRFPLGNILYQ